MRFGVWGMRYGVWGMGNCKYRESGIENQKLTLSTLSTPSTSGTFSVHLNRILYPQYHHLSGDEGKDEAHDA